MELEDFIAS